MDFNRLMTLRRENERVFEIVCRAYLVLIYFHSYTYSIRNTVGYYYNSILKINFSRSEKTLVSSNY